MSFFSRKSFTQTVDFESEIEKLNQTYNCILKDTNEETILHPPIKGYKIKPNKVFGGSSIFANWRYLMFTNQRLYTMDEKEYEKGTIEQEKLVVNNIDLQYLSHMILLPQFSFQQFELMDIKKIKKEDKSVIEGLRSKKCEIIIGFRDQSMSQDFKEADIAFSNDSNMYDAL